MFGFWRTVRRVSSLVLLVAPICFVIVLVHPSGIAGAAGWEIFVGAPAAVFVAFGMHRAATERERRIQDRRARRQARPGLMRRAGRAAARRRADTDRG